LKSYNLTLGRPLVSVVNNPVAFLTGKGDYKRTRKIMRWLDRPVVTVKRKKYLTIEDTDDSYEEPWMNTLPLDGTDGMGVHAL